jgi:hypothetical protein
MSLFSGWQWQDSYEECQAGRVPTGGATTTGTTTPGPSCGDSTVGPRIGDVQQSCTYGGGANCALSIMLSHGFPSSRSNEVIAHFCGGPGDDGNGCDPGYAIRDHLTEFFLIDVPVSILTGGIAAGVFGRGAAAGGVELASGAGGEVGDMAVVRTVVRGEKIADILNEGKVLTFETGNEHALVRLGDGSRAIVSGGPGGIRLGEEVVTVFGHTHPYGLPPTGPSAADFQMLENLDQFSSWLLEHGQLTKFHR